MRSPRTPGRRRRRAALAQPEPLPRLRARRHPQPHRAVERRDVDLRARAPPRGSPPAPRGAGRRPRAGTAGAVSTRTTTNRSPARPPRRPDVAPARNPQLHAVGDPGRHRNGQRSRLAPRRPSPPHARHAACALLPAPAARRARLREHHVSARPADAARALAHRAAHRVHSQHAAARARPARAPGGSPSRSARRPPSPARTTASATRGCRRRPRAPRLRARASRTSANSSPKRRRLVLARHVHREVEPLEPERHRLAGLAGTGRSARVVRAPPLGIAQRLVRLRDLRKARGRLAVARD